MFNTIKNTFNQFLEENKMIIVWIAVLILADHFLLKGKYRVELQNIVQKIISKIEKKLEV